MKLKVEWINATRLADEKKKIEDAYTERLLALFGSTVKAAEMKGHWHRSNKPPVHPWPTYNRISQIEATCNLLPSERRLAAFVVKFEK
jgi:hypothetical protein